MEQLPQEKQPESLDYLSGIHEATINDYTDIQKKRPEFVTTLTERIVTDLDSKDPQKREAAKNGLRALIDKLFVESID